MTRFAELDCLTHYSFLEGASYPQELAFEAKRLGLAAIGVADRNSLAGIVRAWQAGKGEGLEVLTGERISVGAPFFNLTFAPLFLPLLLALPFGPLLAWKRGDLVGAAERLYAAGIVALVSIAVLWAWVRGGSAFSPVPPLLLSTWLRSDSRSAPKRGCSSFDSNTWTSGSMPRPWIDRPDGV